ncbi:PDZ domain-containing protein [Roseimaritima ulvae]|uniref:Periplasmic serine endoprotease DegP n=1 Tax=Roseimaritima ulvae TaxID=980254 RepID=A0A5B9R9R8_9BACT|nr:PDZ domain-containing protein [Roseimaritima ulvae]QEG43771.1 Periplasmic serine endoprotease DegP precursor [Roseimaritima ulvae]
MDSQCLFRLFKPAILPAVAASAVTAAGWAWSADPAPQTQAQRDTPANSQSPSTDQNSATVLDQHADDEAPALGVIVGSCPGRGVCVHDTVWNSPADEAGLRQGDYILSVNGQSVSSPGELKQVVQQLKAGEQANVVVWRQGQEMEKQITLAAKAEQPPASHKAWLGVMLSPADEQGVRIERVMQASPADEAGLRSGDTIIKQGDQQVTDVQSFVESVEDMGPGSPLQLTVRRNGNESKIDVTLGHTEEAPMQFLRAMRPVLPEPWSSNPSDGSTEMLDETLDEMRRQIRELQNQVQEMKADQPRQTNRVDEQDLSQNATTVDTNGTTLVVQRRDGNRRGRGWNRGRDWGNNYNRWDRGYRSGYRGPLSRSPRYGNYYYRYGGRPYYGNFGRGYGYGRSGVQIGNFGVYWY